MAITEKDCLKIFEFAKKNNQEDFIKYLRRNIWDLEVDDSVVDRLIEIGEGYPVTKEEIGRAMSDASKE